MSAICDVFDTSNFPVDHQLFSTVNNEVVGKYIDEFGGKFHKEFVGLR